MEMVVRSVLAGRVVPWVVIRAFVLGPVGVSLDNFPPIRPNLSSIAQEDSRLCPR